MSKIGAYGKVYNLGHAAIKALFLEPVVVEEKIDGSQFSFGNINGELHCRSNNKQIVLDHAGMFEQAVATARLLFPYLEPGWIYRGEYLRKPKHNALAYDRIPNNHIILWDIDTGGQNFLCQDDKAGLAWSLGLELVPLLYEGLIESIDEVLKLMSTVSILGGQKIEGMVFKNYARFDVDGKVLKGKYVSEEFREVHQSDWKKRNPTSKDIVSTIVDQYKTPARWNKAVQHLAESGNLDDSPTDIGPLLKELSQDIEAECKAEIVELLYKWARKDILRGVSRGLPEWYKQKLMEKQFNDV